MSSDKRAASALGAKTARACDSCMRRRARWFCAADDAFLCQGCDASVHSANPLARRHDRVRLKTASFKIEEEDVAAAETEPAMPSWHRGFQRKARTPRHHAKPKVQPPMNNPLLVPELSTDEPSLDENEEQLLYRVPIFDPVVAEFCNSGAATSSEGVMGSAVGEMKPVNLPNYAAAAEGTGAVDNTAGGLLPSDVDLENFAADVESLLGRGLDDVSFCMEGLGLMGTREEDVECCFDGGKVKVEEEEEQVEGVTDCRMDEELDLSRDTLDLNFDYDSPTTGEEEEEKVSVSLLNNGSCVPEEEKRKTSLRLNYDAVITAWASQGSPWTTGDRPHLNPDDCVPDCSSTCAPDLHTYGDMGFLGGHMMAGDGGREARVSRYREKRRTRLFSKKIRYEVRKLNAEKRPRMKGRFVKRASFAGPAFPF